MKKALLKLLSCNVPTSWKEGIFINKHFLDRTIGIFSAVNPEIGEGCLRGFGTPSEVSSIAQSVSREMNVKLEIQIQASQEDLIKESWGKE